MMRHKQIPFYSTQNDLIALLRTASSRRPLSFFDAGTTDKRSPRVFDQAELLEPLKMYLVSDRGVRVVSRRVERHRAPDAFAVDQLKNPDSVSLKCGGRIDDDRLLPGAFGTTSDTATSWQLYDLLSELV